MKIHEIIVLYSMYVIALVERSLLFFGPTSFESHIRDRQGINSLFSALPISRPPVSVPGM